MKHSELEVRVRCADLIVPLQLHPQALLDRSHGPAQPSCAGLAVGGLLGANLVEDAHVLGGDAELVPVIQRQGQLAGAAVPCLRSVKLAALPLCGSKQVGGSHLVPCIPRLLEDLHRVLVELGRPRRVPSVQVQASLVLEEGALKL